jgi:hypothetical protein
VTKIVDFKTRQQRIAELNQQARETWVEPLPWGEHEAEKDPFIEYVQHEIQRSRIVSEAIDEMHKFSTLAEIAETLRSFANTIDKCSVEAGEPESPPF